MSLKKIEQIKAGRMFRPLDIAALAALIAAVALLFVFFVIMPDRTGLAASGAVAEISVGGERVFSFDFGSGEYAILGDSADVTAAASGEKTAVTVKSGSGGEDYNVIVFDRADGGIVTASDTNCSQRHDCTYMKITSVSGTIVCIPHLLKVYIVTDIAPPVSG